MKKNGLTRNDVCKIFTNVREFIGKKQKPYRCKSFCYIDYQLKES